MKIGSLVECISHKSEGYPNHIGLKVGDIYTVRDIVKCKCGCISPPAIYLEEVINIESGLGQEYGYDIEDFREVQPPMSVSIEEIILQPINK